MEIGSVASVVSAALAFFATLWTVFRFISNGDDALRREISAAQKEAALLMEKVAESEAKQRHAMANQVQTGMLKMETDLRTLQREAVRLEQMQAVENRLNGALGKIEIKVDRLAESLTEIIAIKSKLEGMASALTRISDRLDEDNGVRRNTRVS